MPLTFCVAAMRPLTYIYLSIYSEGGVWSWIWQLSHAACFICSLMRLYCMCSTFAIFSIFLSLLFVSCEEVFFSFLNVFSIQLHSIYEEEKGDLRRTDGPTRHHFSSLASSLSSSLCRILNSSNLGMGQHGERATWPSRS